MKRCVSHYKLDLKVSGMESQLAELFCNSNCSYVNDIDNLIKQKDISLACINLPDDEEITPRNCNKDLLSTPRMTNVMKFNSFVYVVSYRSESQNVTSECNLNN